MNTVQEIRRINEAELASGSTASWHDQYKDSAYIHVGGLPYQLTEGDVITIFSQYGEVVDITLPRDPNTQKPRGFAFLMYADQRSTVLAVDNLGGAKVLDRTLKVDHVLNYKQLERDNETGKMKERESQSLAAHPDKFKAVAAPASDSGNDSDSSHGSIDIDDPMRDYLIEQRRAARKAGGGKKRGREGESKEERKERREQKRKAKEEKVRKKEMKALGGRSSSRSKAIEGGSRSEREPERRKDDRDRQPERRRDERDYSPRRRDERDRSPRRRDDRSYGRERSPGSGDRDRPSDYRRDDDLRRDDKDDRDHRRRDGDDDDRRRPGGRSSAFADLEQWAKGR